MFELFKVDLFACEKDGGVVSLRVMVKKVVMKVIWKL